MALVHLAAASALVAGTALPAAAKPGHGGGGSGGSSSPLIGNDVSYPQCGSTLPAGEAFGIVGVDGGLANNRNPCLGPSNQYPGYAQSQLYWAAASATGVATQPKSSLYVNTADPGNMVNGNLIGDWPTSGGNATYGACATTTVTTGSGATAVVGQNSPACAWQYGYDRASQDATWLTQAADAVDAQESATPIADMPASYPWWLDVETANSWQSGTSGQQMNAADLQGMVAALQAAGATRVGVYSTAYQWSSVTGGSSPTSGSLWGLPDWIPGARGLSGAQSNCSLASFTGGSVLVTQWTATIDDDYSCRAWS